MDLRSQDSNGCEGVTELVRVAVAAMATRFEIVMAGTDSIRLRAAGEAALAEIEACDLAWNRFRPDSELSRVVRHAAQGGVNVSMDFMEILLQCVDGWRCTEGAFDVTAGSAPGVTMADVVIDQVRQRVEFRRPGVQLDFGAIAKGVALDRAAALLREVGVTCAILHGGTSSVVAIGSPPRQSGFRVEVPGGAVISLVDEALSVSRIDSPTQSLDHSHIVDPKSQHPLSGAAGVSVIAPTGAHAETWSTALLVSPDLSSPSSVHTFFIGSRPAGRFESSQHPNASRSEAEVLAHELPIAS